VFPLRGFRWLREQAALTRTASAIVPTTATLPRTKAAHAESGRALLGVADLPLDDRLEFRLADGAGAFALETHAAKCNGNALHCQAFLWEFCAKLAREKISEAQRQKPQQQVLKQQQQQNPLLQQKKRRKRKRRQQGQRGVALKPSRNHKR
jgi:hypothetical protein